MTDWEIYGYRDGKPLYRPKGLGDILATALAKDKIAAMRAESDR